MAKESSKKRKKARGKKENSVKKKEDKKKSEEEIRYSKMTMWAIIVSSLVILSILGGYFYVESQKYFNYKGIDFRTTKIGEKNNTILLYETLTLFKSNDGTNQDFGFRIRTKPSKLKRVEFEGLDNFSLKKYNVYSYEENKTFSCEGYGMIAIQNLARLFAKTGEALIYDRNASCDSEGRYNYFYFTYGNETAIKKIGNDCYEIVIKGNDDECEILPVTEKLMVEMYVRYGQQFFNN